MLLNRQNLLICELCGPETPYLEVQQDGTMLAMNAFAAASVTAPDRKLVKYQVRSPKMPVLFHRQEAELMRTEVYKVFPYTADGLGGYRRMVRAVSKNRKPPLFALHGATSNDVHEISPRQVDVPTSLALPSEMDVFDQYVDAMAKHVEVPFVVTDVHKELDRVRMFLHYVRQERKAKEAQCLDLYVRKVQWKHSVWADGMVDDPFAAVLNAAVYNSYGDEDYLDSCLIEKAGHWGKLVGKDLEDRRRYVHVRLNFVLFKRIIRLTKSFLSNDKKARAQVFVPIQKLDRKDSKIRPLVIRAVNERTGQTFVAVQMPMRPSY